MGKISVSIKCFWIDEKTNIFKNYVDALFGAVVLIFLPIISVITTLHNDSFTWSNYTFPIFSICMAGIYDSYSRYEANRPQNVKLGIRAVVDFISLFLAAVFVGQTKACLCVIPPVLLSICGVGLLREVLSRVKTAIEISEWGGQ